jgi:regulatory protein
VGPDRGAEPGREAELSKRQAAARAALAAALSAVGGLGPPRDPQPEDSRFADPQRADWQSAGRQSAGRQQADPQQADPQRADRQSADPQPADQEPADPVERARELCLRLLASRPRTRTELADAMRRHQVPDEAAAAVLARFTDAGLIDDAAFARAWVESRHHNRGLARRALSAELKRRGVDRQDIEAAVSELDPADEVATARQLVDKAMRASRGKPLPTRIRRLVGLLARKGYPAPVAYRIVREAIEQEGIDAEAAGVDLDEAAWATPDADLDAG